VDPRLLHPGARASVTRDRRSHASISPSGGTRSRPAHRCTACWAPLLPALIFTIIVTQIPFLVTIAVSTLNWNVLEPGDNDFIGLGKYESFAGLGNYSTVFTDERLRTAVINTVVLTASVVVISSLIGLGLAVLLDKKFFGRGLARTLLIAPFLVMPVAAALLWKHALYNPDYGLFNGVLNWLYQLFGAGEGPVIDYISSTPMPANCAASFRSIGRYSPKSAIQPLRPKSIIS